MRFRRGRRNSQHKRTCFPVDAAPDRRGKQTAAARGTMKNRQVAQLIRCSAKKKFTAPGRGAVAAPPPSPWSICRCPSMPANDSGPVLRPRLTPIAFAPLGTSPQESHAQGPAAWIDSEDAKGYAPSRFSVASVPPLRGTVCAQEPFRHSAFPRSIPIGSHTVREGQCASKSSRNVVRDGSALESCGNADRSLARNRAIRMPGSATDGGRRKFFPQAAAQEVWPFEAPGRAPR